jgi:bifunctional non-homologous end joining protein LigD
MLATLVAKPFSSPGWIFEEKYDGDRILAYKEGSRVTLLSRNAKARSDRFPTIVAAIAGLAPRAIVLDGEAVVFDSNNISRFQLLQQGRGKPVYAVFDCLYCNGVDLRKTPLVDRLKVLRQWVKGGPSLRLARRLNADGLQAFAQVRKAGFEGLVAKDLASPYIAGRSSFWRKVKVHQEDEFVIAGYTRPAGARKHFGALLLGAYKAGVLRYVGKVGTGFDTETLACLHGRFSELKTRRCPFQDPPPGEGNAYLKPELVAQVSYQELTLDGLLRQPVYLGLRDDKPARQVSLPRPA